MGQVRSTFDGGVVAEPEIRQAGNSTVLEFPVYVNRRKKNRDTGEYEDTGDVTKIRVQLWNDRIDLFEKPSKGDIVEVTGTIYEREYTKSDGTTGRSLETDWVDDIAIKYRGNKTASSDAGFSSSGDGF